MHSYPHTYSKVALALSSGQVAKEALVAEFGVGEDLPFNFFGWSGGDLQVLVGMQREFMSKPVSSRFASCWAACQVMRSVFGCDEITFVAEGFHSSKPELTKGQSLRKLFGEHNFFVKECIAVTHVGLNERRDPQVMLVSVTYNYLAGKFVVWDDETAFTSGAAQVLREAAFPAMMAASLRGSVEVADEEKMEGALDFLEEHGFEVQFFVSDLA